MIIIKYIPSVDAVSASIGPDRRRIATSNVTAQRRTQSAELK